MSEWRSVHYHHSRRNTQSILHRRLFSDVEVRVRGQVFPCHRYVLAQSSDFFFRRFTAAEFLPESSSASSADRRTDAATSGAAVKSSSETGTAELGLPETRGDGGVLSSSHAAELLSSQNSEEVSTGVYPLLNSSTGIRSTLEPSRSLLQGDASQPRASVPEKRQSSPLQASRCEAPPPDTRHGVSSNETGVSSNDEGCDSTKNGKAPVDTNPFSAEEIPASVTEKRHSSPLQATSCEAPPPDTRYSVSSSGTGVSSKDGGCDSTQIGKATVDTNPFSAEEIPTNPFENSHLELISNEKVLGDRAEQRHFELGDSVRVTTHRDGDRDSIEDSPSNSTEVTAQVSVSTKTEKQTLQNSGSDFNKKTSQELNPTSSVSSNTNPFSGDSNETKPPQDGSFSHNSWATVSLEPDSLTPNSQNETEELSENILLSDEGDISEDSSCVTLSDNRYLGERKTGLESSPAAAIVELDFLSADVFRAVLDAVYTGQDPVTDENAVDLFKAAKHLQITSLVQHCEFVISGYLRNRQVDASEVLQDSLMAESSSIVQAALDVLLTDFGPDSCKTEWFLDLPPDNLIAVLNDPRLNVRDEDEVYRALTAWYAHDPWSRERHMTQALTQIRLINLSRRALVEDVLLHPLCVAGGRGAREEGEKGGGGGDDGSGGGEGSDVSLFELVQRALAYHVLPDRRHDELLRCARFRPSQASERVLLVLGDQSDKLYGFSFARRAWFKLAPPPQPLGLGVAACSHGDDLYVCGGDKATTKFWRYRASLNTWKRLKDMSTGRRSHCCVAVGDSIYVLGGKNDKKSNKEDTIGSVEVFDLQAKGQGWKVVTPGALPVPVRSMAAAVVGDNIYIFGGRTNGFQKTVDVIQCFDTTTQQGTVVGHLASPSCLGRVFVANKVVYILEANGDIMRFQPKFLHDIEDQNDQSKERDSAQPSIAVSVKLHQNAEDIFVEIKDSASSKLLSQDSKHQNSHNSYQSTARESAVSKVGWVKNLNWKWFGVARGHEGTLYVIGGEMAERLPAGAVPPTPKFSVVTDNDVTDIGQACFIRPEKMALCYVYCHMCIPKTFLLEKLV